MSTGAGRLDDFESMFRSALGEVFHYAPPTLTQIAVVTDLPADATDALTARIGAWLGVDAQLKAWPRPAWAAGPDPSIPTLLARLADDPPDLIVGLRHLLGHQRDLAHSLGSVVDTLTQAQPAPVLLLASVGDVLPEALRHVLGVTDHITGDDLLVNWATALTPADGRLFLAHVEDDLTTERFLATIERIAGLDSDLARAKIPDKLLAQPRDYLASIGTVLAEHGVGETLVPIVRTGHALTDYRHLVDAHDIDLIVVNSRDDRQWAMHGLAHALAVELRHRPLLLL